MNNQTEVARLDRSEPPEGYQVGRGQWSCPAAVQPGTIQGKPWTSARFCTEGQELECAWTHREARQDPPGMRVEVANGVATAGVATAWVDCDPSGPVPAWRRRGGIEADARAAAWAWYWRRVDLANRLDASPLGMPGTKRGNGWLEWTDEDCEKVERALAEVLRG
jgi:hypothetical protein